MAGNIYKSEPEAGYGNIYGGASLGGAWDAIKGPLMALAGGQTGAPQAPGPSPYPQRPQPSGLDALRARQSSGAGAYGPGYSGGADLTSPFGPVSRVADAPLGSPVGGGAPPTPQMSLLRDTVAADMAPGQGYRSNQYGIPGVYQGTQRFGQAEVPLFYNQGARPLGGVDATQRVKDEAQAITDRSMAQSPYATALQRGPQQPERVTGPFSMSRGPGGPDYSFADQMQSMALDRLGKAQYAQQRDAAMEMLRGVPQMRREADLSYYQPRQFEQTQAMEREKMQALAGLEQMKLGSQNAMEKYRIGAEGGLDLARRQQALEYQQAVAGQKALGQGPKMPEEYISTILNPQMARQLYATFDSTYNPEDLNAQDGFNNWHRRELERLGIGVPPRLSTQQETYGGSTWGQKLGFG